MSHSPKGGRLPQPLPCDLPPAELPYKRLPYPYDPVDFGPGIPASGRGPLSPDRLPLGAVRYPGASPGATCSLLKSLYYGLGGNAAAKPLAPKKDKSFGGASGSIPPMPDADESSAAYKVLAAGVDMGCAWAVSVWQELGFE